MVLDAVTFILFVMLLGFTQPVFIVPQGTAWGGVRLFSGFLWLVTLIAFLAHLFGHFP